MLFAGDSIQNQMFDAMLCNLYQNNPLNISIILKTQTLNQLISQHWIACVNITNANMNVTVKKCINLFFYRIYRPQINNETKSFFLIFVI